MNDKKNYSDLIAGLIVMGIAVFFFCTTFGTKSFMLGGTGSLAPDSVPKFVAVLMFIFGVGVVIKWAVDSSRGRIKPREVEDDTPNLVGLTDEQIKTRKFWQKATMPATLVLICLYIFLMPKIGFTISTFLYLTAQIMVLSTDFSVKSWVKNVIIAIIAALLIFIVFGCAFQLAVPSVSAIDLGIKSAFNNIVG